MPRARPDAATPPGRRAGSGSAPTRPAAGSRRAYRRCFRAGVELVNGLVGGSEGRPVGSVAGTPLSRHSFVDPLGGEVGEEGDRSPSTFPSHVTPTSSSTSSSRVQVGRHQPTSSGVPRSSRVSVRRKRSPTLGRPCPRACPSARRDPPRGSGAPRRRQWSARMRASGPPPHTRPPRRGDHRHAASQGERTAGLLCPADEGAPLRAAQTKATLPSGQGLLTSCFSAHTEPNGE
jgi:hypothetical protein